MRPFAAFGKAVYDAAGTHFADATSELNALLIVAALNFRQHIPALSEGAVRCSRCQALLPDEGSEPCQPRPPRCPDTADLFSMGAQADEQPTTTAVPSVQQPGERDPERKAALQRSRTKRDPHPEKGARQLGLAK